MSLRTRTVLWVIPLIALTILFTAGVVAFSARQSILAQTQANGELLTEQFARGISVGEQIRRESEALFEQQKAAEAQLAPLLPILAQATGTSQEQIKAQLDAAIGRSAWEEFAARRMEKGAWLGQFLNEVLSENVSAIWVVDEQFATQFHDALPGAGISPEIGPNDRALIKSAMDEKRTLHYYDENFLLVARHVTGSQGEVIGATLIYYPTQRVQQALSRQLQLTAIVALIVLGVGALASVLVAQSLSRPLQHLTQAAQLMEAGQFTLEQAAEFKATGGEGEINHLRRVFGRMAQEVILRYQETQKRNAELQAVYQIAQAITASSSNPDEALQTILERVEQIIPYDGSEICLYVPEEDGLQVRAWRGQTASIDSRGRLYRMGEGFTGRVGQARSCLLVPDIERHPTIKARYPQLGESLFIRSYIGVPLLVGERLVGTLELVGTQINMFDAHTQQLLETIAPQAAIAIETAQRVEARERKLHEQIAQLRIEIDEVKKARQVAEITETEYFQQLRQKARSLRANAASKT